MKKVCVLKASPRHHGNTNSLADICIEVLRKNGLEIREFDLYRMDVRPCLACRMCQKDWTEITCVQKDDMAQIFETVALSELLILATPIYSWYCTPPMKSALDRLVYAMNMYYGEKRGPSLWAGKSVSLIATCGYRPEKGADLFEEGMKRYCKHSQLRYMGMLCERHLGYHTEFMDEDKKKHAIEFALQLLQNI